MTRRILIVKPSSLGDIVDTLPAVGAIRKRFPSATISWLVKLEWAPILRGHPFVDEVIAVSFSWKAIPQMIRVVRNQMFDLVIDFQGLLRSALLSYATKAKVRVGFSAAREGARWFYTDPITVPEKVVHAVDRYRWLARALGCNVNEVRFGFLPTSEVAEKVTDLLSECGLSGSVSFVLIHPTARWENKRWEPARFAALADRVILGRRLPLFFVGSGNEREEIDRIVRGMKQPTVNLAGRTTLPELAELARRARLFICNDSGPMHLAAAVGTPIVALFGPTDPKKVGPYGPGHIVIRKGVGCIGCSRNHCVRGNECMNAISVDDVIHKIKMRGEEDGNR
ncbi:MAG: glycosyltransferase family 9 protein [Candidatus Manganitrophaceae bacterium]